VKTCLPVFALFAGLSGCAQKQDRFVWGNYEAALYASYADAGKTLELVAALAKATTEGDAAGKTAPGLHAEYGYLLLSSGRSQDAVEHFQKERQLFPESRMLMDKMIALAVSGKPVAPAEKPATSKVGS
jgi:hypothetical protein